MKNYKITKEDIFQKTEGGLDIIRYYVPEIDECLRTKKKFKLHEEETPSSSIKKMSDGNYVVADFGDGGRWMNGIALVQDKEKVEYGEAIRIIAERHGIGSSEEIKSMYEAEVSTADAAPDQADGTWIFNPCQEVTENHLRIIFSDKVFTYLEYTTYKDKKTPEEKKEAALSHLRKLLISQHWHSLESYTIIKKRKAITFTATEFYPIFRIEEVRKDDKTFSKVYQPKSKDKSRRFFYHGDFDPQFLHGLKQVERAYEEWFDDQETEENPDPKLPEIIFCTGGSDALNLAALGYQVIYPSSEYFKLTKDHLFELNRIADNVFTCPDLDTTGQLQNLRLCLTDTHESYLNIRTIELPESLKSRRDQYGRPCKDVRDFLKFYRGQDFKNLVKVALMLRFWDAHIALDRSGKEKIRYGKKLYEYKLSTERVLNFLKKSGFGRRKVNDETMEFIQIDNNLVRQVKPEDIKAFLLNFLRSRFMPEELLNVVHRSPMLSAASFDSLPILDPDFRDYEEHAQYMFFKNITWKITAESIEEIKNEKVNKMVWESRIIDKSVKKLDPMFECYTDEKGKLRLKVLNQDCMFFRILIQTSRVHWRKEFEDNLEDLSNEERDAYRTANKFNISGPNLTDEECQEQEQHCLNKMFAFGYMMHRYKAMSRPWIVMPMDDTPNKDSGSHGGTGKSLFFLGLRQIRNVLQLDGKNDNLFNDNHVFEQVTTNTDIIYIDDASRNFPMERTFSMTTGDITVNPKGKTRTSIPYHLSPKMGLTTNFAPDDLGASSMRRILFLGMSNWYHDNKMGMFNEARIPRDDFGKELFTQYNEKEWNDSLNFMAQCCQFYLSQPNMIEAPMENIMDRALTNNMGFNFLAWAEVFFSKESGRLDIHVPTTYAIEDYKAEANVKALTPNGFNQKIKMYAQLKHMECNPKELLNSEGRLTKNWYEIKYDNREKCWQKTNRKKMKTQSMIYLRSKDAEINMEVFDPTEDAIDSVEAPQPEQKKTLPF